jgi:DNA-binding transcriptional ArsR family regulator
MPAAALFRSLADPARLAIVRHLAAGPARVVDLTEPWSKQESTTSSSQTRSCHRTKPTGWPGWPTIPR